MPLSTNISFLELLLGAIEISTEGVQTLDTLSYKCLPFVGKFNFSLCCKFFGDDPICVSKKEALAKGTRLIV